MANKYYPVGTVFQLGLIKAKCIERKELCKDCILDSSLDAELCSKLIGSCVFTERPDLKDVIFIETTEALTQ